MKTRKMVQCKYADWDDTTYPHPTCHCLKRDNDMNCANDKTDIKQCPDFKEMK
jgi:hypothetical protein